MSAERRAIGFAFRGVGSWIVVCREGWRSRVVLISLQTVDEQRVGAPEVAFAELLACEGARVWGGRGDHSRV